MPYALTVKKTDGKPGQVYYPLVLKDVPRPTPGPGELLVRIRAVALNHRDLFIRQNLYPGISFENPLLADGFGVVEEVGPGCQRGDVAKVGAGVVLVPCRNWIDDPDGPEDYARFSVIGGAAAVDAGTATEYLTVPEAELELAPAHLSPTEAAALPLVGLTAWRALVTKANIAAAPPRGGGGGGPTRNVLVTGIGGGRRGRRALLQQLPAERPLFDAIVDGAGGDIIKRACRLLRPGGVVSSYGMTVGPKMDWLMSAVLRNLELKGSTMGSRAEFRAMVAFVREHKIRPVVSRVAYGGLSHASLPAIESLFEDMKGGKQFGKLVLSFDKEPTPGPDSPSKL
ncbi:alcohol dehydrogenase [Niveomyces insectorum RCEF 264]|uniref:Alcohol dehydrogenase n=1 Tax=Niveomyces insectorum RCEF 264 TaxID=1081102 RepID=A0A168A9G9_9HYPO|nr:alcohol dehydrogenase [Niveomyces insectorum RCEF 264]